jgi:hypothetical protein
MSAAAVDPTTRAPRRSAQLGAYALIQLRDYFMDRGLSTILVTLLLTYAILAPLHAALNLRAAAGSARALAQYGSAEGARAALLAEMTSTFLRMALGNMVFLGALFAMNGIVSNDRKQGFYRFLFAKPMAPPRYYGQAFLLHWAGFMAVMLVLGGAYTLFIGPVLTAPLVLTMALMFLCYAGIAFALSAAARWDWLSLVAVTVAATLLWDRYRASTSPLAKLLYLLPPLHETGAVYTAAATGVALPWHSLAWLAGYGAASFAIGLVVLRHRRLAII